MLYERLERTKMRLTYAEWYDAAKREQLEAEGWRVTEETAHDTGARTVLVIIERVLFSTELPDGAEPDAGKLLGHCV